MSMLRPRTVTIAYGFVILNIAIWFVLGIVIAFNLHPAMPEQPLARGVMAILSFAAGCALLVTYTFLRRHNRAAFVLMLLFLGIASVLVFFDDVGLVDLGALTVSLIPFILLVKDRNWHLQQETPRTNG